KAENKKAVIGLDFGTTHSGFSYALTSNRKIHTEKKENGQFKEPTCALFDRTGRLLAYGFEARNTYLRRLAEEQALLSTINSKLLDDYLYFDYDKLKMRLYSSKDRELM